LSKTCHDQYKPTTYAHAGEIEQFHVKPVSLTARESERVVTCQIFYYRTFTTLSLPYSA